MTSRIVDALATTEALSAIFGDASTVQVLLDVEAALARAQAALGVIPASAAAAITQAAVADGFDVDALAREARASATIVIPLVAALTARVEAIDPVAARYVHWGATSQDIVDTAVSVQIERAGHALTRDHAALAEQLRLLSDRHAGHGDARPHAAAARAADHVRPEGGGLVREPVPELGARRAGVARRRAHPVRRRVRHARGARGSRPGGRRRAGARARGCRRPPRHGTPRAIGSRRWSPPARSTPASSARSPATSAC